MKLILPIVLAITVAYEIIEAFVWMISEVIRELWGKRKSQPKPKEEDLHR